MNRRIFLSCLGWISGFRNPFASAQPKEEAVSARFQQPNPVKFPDLFTWTDVCNVHVIKDGDEALLINLGDGTVLEHLKSIGVRRIKWLFLTDHHREQFQGIDRLDRSLTKVAAPKAEQVFFENPTSFRKWRASLGDPHTVHGASYLRPPRKPVRLDRVCQPEQTFVWKGRELKCLATLGHSPGGMSFALQKGDHTVLFTGGIMHDGAIMRNWFDTEWDYGFAKGIDALIGTVNQLEKQPMDLALPSQGPAIKNPREQFKRYRHKLTHFKEHLLRGYPVFDSTPEDFDPVSKPTMVPNVNRVSPHLYKLSTDHPGMNFAMIISDEGKGLIIDCGLFPEERLDQVIAGMRKHLGLKEIEVMWVTHMHGDHFLLGPALKKKYDVETWSLDVVADKCEHPMRYDYSALVSAYGAGIDGMTIDKRFRSGDIIKWEGYTLHVNWMPGQTEFGSCLWLELDGQRVAFTGDNLFGNPRKESHDGHECVVARNSAIIEEGYLQAAKYLRKIKPDLLMGGHSWVMEKPNEFIERYHAWGLEMIKIFKNLLPDEDYEYLFDPYWVSAYPYRVDLSEKYDSLVEITVRNFRGRPQKHQVELKLPAGITADPTILTGTIPARSRETFPVKLKIDRNKAPKGLQIVPFDITLDDKRHGELFDFLVKT